MGSLGRKISKFTDASLPLSGKELLDIVQNGQNVKSPLSSLVSLVSGLGFEESASYAAISDSTAPRLILVDVDEENNDNRSLYLFTGSELLFLLTIMP